MTQQSNITINDKNLKYEIETCASILASAAGWGLWAINDKNLKYEIETSQHDSQTGRSHRPINDKNLKYEIETSSRYLPYQPLYPYQ